MDRATLTAGLSTTLATELSASEERLSCVIELSSDYYWEQDENYRFVLFRHRDMMTPRNSPWLFVGKARWELDDTQPIEGESAWSAHKALLSRHRSFRDFVVCRTDSAGNKQYLSVSGKPIFDSRGLFKGYRGITRDVTRDQVRSRLLRLERSVTRILTDTDKSSDALRDALKAICESEAWDAGQYWYLDEAQNAMRFSTGWNVAEARTERISQQARGLSFAPGVGLVGLAWKTNQPLWISDLDKETKHLLRKQIVEESGWRSAMLFPVNSEGRTIGILDFNSKRIQEAPDERLLQVVSVLGTQIGNFHQRAVTLERLRESQRRYSDTIELAAIGICHVLDGRFIHVNRRVCDMLGYTRHELLALTTKQISHPEDVELTKAKQQRLREGAIESFKAEKRYLCKDGSTIWVRLTVAVKRAATGGILYEIAVIEDISERKRAEERIQYLASHDNLTGLPNRASFAQYLKDAIRNSRREASGFAVLFIDLDRFKQINDSLGHEAGDQLLREKSAKLKECLEPGDVLARFGGDEFVVLTARAGLPHSAEKLARGLLSEAIRPVTIKGKECRVTASIGIALYPGDAVDGPSLLKHADVAMYLAKEEGKNTFQFFRKHADSQSIERLALETALSSALERNELFVHYQPKVNIASGRITGAEALLRWWNQDLGTVSPAQFIPIAEDTGLIVPIGRWILETACAQAVAWQQAGLGPIHIAVNLSARQFRDLQLIKDVAEVLKKTGLPPGLLELEITESLLMHNVEQAVHMLNAIKDLGIRLAIDDFGTGYSSLAQLKRFPFDTLKIDRSFIREIPKDAEDMAITKAIVAMGRTLGVTVIAEGVETSEQRNFLRSLECDEMQGFYFSKPCHPDRFAELLKATCAAKSA